MNITIEFKNRPAIAHEVVFPVYMELNITNAFRFALKSYLYHKDLALNQFHPHSGLSSNTLLRQLGITKGGNKFITYKTAVAACNFFGVEFDFLYLVAEQLVKNPEYNAISFAKNDSKVIFFKAYKFQYYV